MKKMMMMVAVGLVGCLGLMMAAGCGSTGSAAPGTSYAYVPGDTSGYVPNEEQEVIDASTKVLKTTDIVVISKQTNEQGRTRIKGETGDGTSVEVTVRPHDEATFLAVKVGLIGDDEASAALFSKIRQELGLAVR